MNEGRQFLEAVATHAKLMFRHADATCQANMNEAAWLLDPLARWSREAFGAEIFEQAAKGYSRYCLTVSKAQQQYESTGIYNPDSYSEIEQNVYDDPDYMIPYMWAAVLIYAFWPSMVNHIRMYRDQFLRALPKTPQLLELGCGHGVLGLLAANHRNDARVHGIDLSASAIAIATKLLQASDLGARVQVEVQDATQLAEKEKNRYDGVIFAMLAEHVSDPSGLLKSVQQNLAPDGIVYFSTAIESPQPDHIYEFHSESEVLRLVEKAGLRARSMVSDASRVSPNAKYLPRAVAMILEHR